jgi:hypothetical protein
MKAHLVVLLLLVAMIAAACDTAGGPTSSPTTSGPGASPSASATTRTGPEGLVEDLKDRGPNARLAGDFDASGIAEAGVTLCVGDEPVQLYVYGTAEEAFARARAIDPRDPSNFGTMIIEWAGNPKFWLRDRMLVLYLGNDQPTIDVLLEALGEPFAVGQGRPPLPGPEVC